MQPFDGPGNVAGILPGRGFARGGRMLFLVNWGKSRESLRVDFCRKGEVIQFDLSGAEEKMPSRSTVELPPRSARVLLFRPRGK